MRGYAAVGLVKPKNRINIGSVLRAASCYEASLIIIEARRNVNLRAATDTHKTWRRVPVITTDNILDTIPYSCVPIAVELVEDARPLPEFIHPQRALYIFGPEDGSIPKQILERCAHTVQIPTFNCMNLAATVNVVLYDRLSKGMKKYGN